MRTERPLELIEAELREAIDEMANAVEAEAGLIMERATLIRLYSLDRIMRPCEDGKCSKGCKQGQDIEKRTEITRMKTREIAAKLTRLETEYDYEKES